MPSVQVRRAGAVGQPPVPTQRRRGEAVLVGLAALLLAAVMTWPTLWHPASTVPEDLGDPLLQTWQAAWGGHALLTSPASVFDSNTFWPLRNSLAFSDSLLGYAPAGLVGHGTAAALLRYNLLYVAAFALAFVGAYALARQLGTSPGAAAVCGAAYAYAPWRIAQSGHLHILSSGGVALALALLARGHGVRARAGPPRGDGHRGAGAGPPGHHSASVHASRPVSAALGWAVAAWQLTIGFGLGLPFAYLLGLICLVVAVRWFRTGRRRWPRRLVLVDAVGLVGFLAVGLLMALPYLRVVSEHPEAKRDASTVAIFSPPWWGFLTPPEQSRVWGAPTARLRGTLGYAPEMTLAPGATVIVAAVAGMVLAGRIGWTRRRRMVLAAGIVVGLVLAMGTRTPGGGHLTYLVLLQHAPGWAGIRTPGRLIVLVTLALGLLAAAGVDALARSVRRARLLPVGALALVLLEGLSTIPHPRPEPAPAALAAARSPLLILPSDDAPDEQAMFWSIDGFPRTVNGTSGFTPTLQARLRSGTAGFPDAASVRLLRSAGVRSVVVLRDRVRGTPWAGAADRPVAGLPVTRREVGNAVVFSLPAG